MRQPQIPGMIPRPWLFWTGVGLSSLGIALHVQMLFDISPSGGAASHSGHTGHSSVVMWLAVAAIVEGVVLAGIGLVPKRRTSESATAVTEDPAPIAPERRATLRTRLVVVLAFALMVDQMKPATLAFILPGARAEYGLTAAEVSMLPLGALCGTVVGSLVWGRLADVIGRRAAVLLAALLFVATTVCGAMPTFEGNVIMCIIMGMPAGGMLPIVYTLLLELLPNRSAMMVLTAGLTSVGGYLAASGLAAVFVPMLGWRSLWFLQLPLALALLGLNRWIPESPSFLAAQGRHAEARRTALCFGLPQPVPEPRTPGGVRPLFSAAYRRQSTLICAFALSWGLVYWGFMTFLPTVLSQAGLPVTAPEILFYSALLSIPGTAAAAWLYSRWSTRRTMTLYGALSALGLLTLTTVPLGEAALAIPALIGLLTGTSGVVAVLGPYTAQTYPTAFRGMGNGLSAACTKSGGIIGPPLIGSMLSVMPLGRVAMLVAVPIALSTAAVSCWGRETGVAPASSVDPVKTEHAHTPEAAGARP
ncbi:MFS transporter [Streptomyces goshikiensis]|uniref:MFS transporter n=1 Tax=Streptomyces goshikiensis TaxID=1942 RepID=UPI0016757F9B|nr:MFS transporter [Streptomyces goshikiensis]GHD81384.1 MFS transporter [Streptomyces goshikiensis]